jgi:hypothetical protein
MFVALRRTNLQKRAVPLTAAGSMTRNNGAPRTTGERGANDPLRR